MITYKHNKGQTRIMFFCMLELVRTCVKLHVQIANEKPPSPIIYMDSYFNDPVTNTYTGINHLYRFTTDFINLVKYEGGPLILLRSMRCRNGWVWSLICVPLHFRPGLPFLKVEINYENLKDFIHKLVVDKYFQV